MQRSIFLAASGALLLAFGISCSAYNEQPSTTPIAAAPSPVQTTASQVTPAASPCGSTAAPVPSVVAGVPTVPAAAKTVTTPSGLQYIDVSAGTGATADAGKTATVHYTGWLVDGTKFDSSRDRGPAFMFPLGGGQVIKGWDEGVAGMHVGGQRRLIVPPGLGYGAQAAGGKIPPCSTLIFDVELLGIK